MDRPGLDQMRALARRRGFDVLLTCGPERLARDFKLQAIVVEELERFGVGTILLGCAPVDDQDSNGNHGSRGR